MKLVVANWKMNPQTPSEALRLAKAVCAGARKIKRAKVVLCIPYTWISELRRIIKKPIEVGAQDVSFATSGAFTGEISPTMLRNLGCSWVIVGHSERRTMLYETDEMINRKLRNALESGFRVVLAVGEQKREGSRHVVDAVLENQLKHALFNIKQKYAHRIIVAYEPVWAIGTGVHARPHDALQGALVARKVFAKYFGASVGNALKVLYGGSVDAKNVGRYVNQSGINGVLVGGASLNPAGFINLVLQLR